MPSARRRTARHPPQPEQPHDVVDPQPAGVPQDAAHDVAERRVAGLREPVGPPRRQPPVLALLVERVGRRADGRPEREGVLQGPGVGAARVDPDGEVVDDADRHAAAETGELLVDEQLHPAPEGDALGVLLAGRGDARAVGAPQRLGPGLPGDAVHLGQRAEQRELLERLALRRAPGGEVLLAVQRPEQLERRQLRAPRRVARDAVGVGHRLERRHRRPDVGGRRGVLGDVLDVQVQR